MDDEPVALNQTSKKYEVTGWEALGSLGLAGCVCLLLGIGLTKWASHVDVPPKPPRQTYKLQIKYDAKCEGPEFYFHQLHEGGWGQIASARRAWTGELIMHDFNVETLERVLGAKVDIDFQKIE